MTTLNARANQAWQDMEDELNEDDCVPNFVSEQDAWEEGWETGYKTARAEVAEEIAKALEAIPADVYPEDIFPPDGASVDAHSARVMRVAYPAAAHIAREIGEEVPS